MDLLGNKEAVFGAAAEARVELSVPPVEKVEQTPLEADRAALEAQRKASAALAAKEFLVPVKKDGDPAVEQDPLLVEIERALQAKLSEVLDLEFPPDQADKRERFVQAGRALAQSLFLVGAKLKPVKVTKLVAEWLRTLPATNYAFITQLAKDKTDAIMAAVREK